MIGILLAALLAADFHFVILGDRTGEAQPGVFEQVWKETVAEKPDFIVTVGDTIQGLNDATADAEWRQAQIATHIPLYLTPGNHDIWSALSERLFTKYSGHPVRYSFDHEQAHFTILDNSRNDQFTPAELAWLEADLKAHQRQPLKFVVSHRPSWLIPILLKNPQDPVHQLAKKYEVQYVVSGHVHQMIHATLEGVTYLSMPSAGGHLRASEKYEDGWFFAHTLVDVAGAEVRIHIKETKPGGRVTEPSPPGAPPACCTIDLIRSSTMLIIAAILSILVYGVIAALLGTVMPSFTAMFGLTGEQNGNIAFAQGLGLVIASLSVGPLIDMRGKKTALLGGLTLITIALAGLPSAVGYTQLMMLYFVLGLGGGIIVTGANALASDVSESRRASTLNFLNLFFGLGGLLTPFLAANLLNGDTAKLCYLGAGLGVVALVANIVAKIPPPTGERGFKVSEVGIILGRPVLYLLALFLFLYVACEVGVWNWLASYLISRNIDKAKALNILSLGFALGLLVGRVVVSRILIKISSITVTLAASVLMAGTTYMMLQSSDATMAGIAVFCAGLAMAPVFPTTLAMVADAFPRGTATAMGIVITCGWLGLMVSSPIIGAVAGVGNANLGKALLLLPAFSVAMVLVNLALRPMLAKK